MQKVECHQADVRHSPVPVVEVDVEHDGAEREAGLEQDALRVLSAPAEHGHLSVTRLLTRNLLDVLNVLNLICL